MRGGKGIWEVSSRIIELVGKCFGRTLCIHSTLSPGQHLGGEFQAAAYAGCGNGSPSNTLTPSLGAKQTAHSKMAVEMKAG